MSSSHQSRISQGSDGSPMCRGYQSTPPTNLNDTEGDEETPPFVGETPPFVEETPPFVISRPAGLDKQKAAKKKGKGVAEPSESYTAQLLDYGSGTISEQR
ncbi:unnamed protein product [Linum trigynum]|uniref:Uncharacterized protein n=1 Tax=Linum trigynum TaxID=586398 RepID=A0AAV2GK75_9ROSI